MRFFLFVYLNYQFNYLDTSCELFLDGDIWRNMSSNRHIEDTKFNTIELVVIAMFEEGFNPHVDIVLTFVNFCLFLLADFLLYGRFEILNELIHGWTQAEENTTGV